MSESPGGGGESPEFTHKRVERPTIIRVPEVIREIVTVAPKRQDDDVDAVINGQRGLIDKLLKEVDKVPAGISGYLTAIDTYRDSIRALNDKSSKPSPLAIQLAKKQGETLDSFRKALGELPEGLKAVELAIDSYRSSLDEQLKSVEQTHARG